MTDVFEPNSSRCNQESDNGSENSLNEEAVIRIGKVDARLIDLVRVIYKYAISITSSRVFAIPIFLFKCTKNHEDNRTKYSCIISLPQNSPAKAWITAGPECESKRVAKFLVAAQPCQMLYESGELKDNLIPVSFEIKQAEEEARRQVRERQKIEYEFRPIPMWKSLMPDSNGIQKPHWLYRVWVENRILGIGFLSWDNLAEKQFSIFHRTAQIITSLRVDLSKQLNDSELQIETIKTIRAFTGHIIEILSKEKNAGKNGFLLNSRTLHALLFRSKTIPTKLTTKFYPNLSLLKKDDGESCEVVLDKGNKPTKSSLVYRLYGNIHLRSSLLVVKDLSDRSANSAIKIKDDGNKETYADYMKQAYNITINYPSDQLVHCSSVHRTLQYMQMKKLWPLKIRDYSNSTTKSVLLVQECVQVLPTKMEHVYESGLVLKCLWELVRYKRSISLSQKIIELLAVGAGVTDKIKIQISQVTAWPAKPNCGSLTKSWEQPLINDHRSFVNIKVNPFNEPSIEKLCGDFYNKKENIIRLPEDLTTGLNIATTLHSYVILKTVATLYFFNTSDEEKSNESILSSNRQLLISNDFLFQVAEKLKIRNFLAVEKFTVLRRDHLEDLLQFSDVYQNESSTMNYKRLSDVIEAILGVFFVSTGSFNLCIRLLSGLYGRSLTPDKHFVCKPNQIQANSSLPGSSQLTDSLENLWRSRSLYQLEKILQYEFRNKKLLMEATSHASDVANNQTVCYERLEFLGDGILDFLVSWHIYAECPDFDPGKLSRLKGVLVSNRLLATICALNGIHRYLSYGSNKMMHSIDEFFAFLVSIADTLAPAKYPYAKLPQCNFKEPKYMADMIESCAGAIFIDSDYSFNAVWLSFYPILQYPIEQHIKAEKDKSDEKANILAIAIDSSNQTNQEDAVVDAIRDRCDSEHVSDLAKYKISNATTHISIDCGNTNNYKYEFQNNIDRKRSNDEQNANTIIATKRLRLSEKFPDWEK
ncbi:hypothetical protein ACOME3_004390 [Neoechinorhynchus agilis]